MNVMNKSMLYIVPLLALVSAGCSDAPVEDATPGAVCFSVLHEWNDDGVSESRASGGDEFTSGDEMGVFACWTEQAGTSTFTTPNFMNRQVVRFDGTTWTYSPIKYWPSNGYMEFMAYYPHLSVDAGGPEIKEYREDTQTPVFNFECRTGFETFLVANSSVNISNGQRSGDVSDNGTLQFGFVPAPNKYKFSATAKKELFDEPATDEYTECRYLIRELRVWGVYRYAEYDLAAKKWSMHRVEYTQDNPLELTPYLAKVLTEEAVEGYHYNPLGYDTEMAVVIPEAEVVDLFQRYVYLIPMEGTIAGNDPGFEVRYVVLTNPPGQQEYKESGIITRIGTLKEAIEYQNHDKVIHIVLNFSHEEVTVTANTEEYHYKPMF